MEKSKKIKYSKEAGKMLEKIFKLPEEIKKRKTK